MWNPYGDEKQSRSNAPLTKVGANKERYTTADKKYFEKFIWSTDFYNNIFENKNVEILYMNLLKNKVLRGPFKSRGPERI